MAWNWKPQGVGPTEGNISFSGGISPQYAPRNQISDAAQEAIKTITAFLQQKERNEIANQILAVDNAPKAVAVNGMQPDSTRYTPDRMLTQAMMARNVSQGLPAQDSGRVPDYGGVTGLQTADLMRERMRERLKEDWQMEDRPLDLAIKKAAIINKLRPPAPHRDPNDLTPDFKYKVTHPELFPKKPEYDPAQMADYTAQRGAYYGERNDLDKKMRQYGLTPEQFAQVDTSIPGGVTKDNRQLPGVTFKSTLDFGDEATNSYGEKIKPGSALSETDAANLAGKSKSPNAVVAEGTVAGKKFRIPFNDYYDLLNRSRNLPVKPETPKPIAAPAPAAGQGNKPSGPTKGTERTINGTPAVWDGYGWVAKG